MTCGSDGTCDGAGACRPYSGATTCAAARVRRIDGDAGAHLQRRRRLPDGAAGVVRAVPVRRRRRLPDQLRERRRLPGAQRLHGHDVRAAGARAARAAPADPAVPEARAARRAAWAARPAPPARREPARYDRRGRTRWHHGNAEARRGATGGSGGAAGTTGGAGSGGGADGRQRGARRARSAARGGGAPARRARRSGADGTGGTGCPGYAFCDDFEDGDTVGWTPNGGTWSVITDGSRVYQGGNGNSFSLAGSAGVDGPDDHRAREGAAVRRHQHVVSRRHRRARDRYVEPVRVRDRRERRAALAQGDQLAVGEHGATGTCGKVTPTPLAAANTWYTMQIKVAGTGNNVFAHDVLQRHADPRLPDHRRHAVGRWPAGTYIYGPNTIAEFDDVRISTP